MAAGNYHASMDTAVQRNIVVSAVNVRKGGTLTVLRDCLRYLGGRGDLHVTALVHKKELCAFPGIDYIEIPWSAEGWLKRLWCEYVTMNRISRTLPDVDLWLSLHDTTPRVKAKRQAVYCHTSFPFMKPTLRDLRMDYKIPLFSLFTKYAYRWNVRKNQYLIVQQEWMRQALAALVSFPASRIIIAPPSFEHPGITAVPSNPPMFLYVGTPDCHKNFETVCQASEMLEKRMGKGRFCVVFTISGHENRYAQWLRRRWCHVDSIQFRGYLSREELAQAYGKASCLVFPSRIETWGLPISEFLPTGKPMILADIPYAHGTAAGASKVAYFPVRDSERLALLMQEVMEKREGSFGPVPVQDFRAPFARDWDSLFDILLK